MYAHAREGEMHIAERVKKKTGTKWDRDQLGCARVAEGQRVEENEGNASRSCGVHNFTREKKRTGGLLWPFLGLVKDNV
jgi:hypothetical protein